MEQQGTNSQIQSSGLEKNGLSRLAAQIAEHYRHVGAIVLKDGSRVQRDDSRFPFELARVVIEESRGLFVHHDDCFDGADVYTIAGVRVSREVFQVFAKAANEGHTFRLVKAASAADPVVTIETIATKDSSIPQHPFELRISIGGDDWDYVLRTIEDLAVHIKAHGPDCSMMSGGGGGSAFHHRPEARHLPRRIP